MPDSCWERCIMRATNSCCRYTGDRTWEGTRYHGVTGSGVASYAPFRRYRPATRPKQGEKKKKREALGDA
ncbi:hypothetical protein EYF80_018342 [Liparis tanakae]|uniref:Uncharacterized protein n=1 Tax=Liparis tanakae TaxID=230148 RepID=A0A4Z2I2C6_9TELE|nr:hypothetical protein EYF80_018342 [Liparis tanakae]